MAKVLLVWGDMDESNYDWYENEYIPELKSRIATRSAHLDAIENPFKEALGFALPLLTVYDIAEPETLNEKSTSAEVLFKGVPKDACFEARSYSEVQRFAGQRARPGYAKVGCMTASFWQPHEGKHDEIMKWLNDECIPGLMESPQFIAGRILKVDHVSTFGEESKVQMKEKDHYSYLTLLEWDADELPWEVLVPLGGSEQWRYYVEMGMDYKIAQYVTVKLYPHEDDSDESEKAEED